MIKESWEQIRKDIAAGETDRGDGVRHKWYELGEIVDSGVIIDMLDYIKRLERYALDGDGYRCESCQMVFDCDDGTYDGGDDGCWFCNSCFDILAEAKS